MSPEWITAICAVLLLVGGFCAWTLNHFTSKEYMVRVEKVVEKIQKDHEVLFSNQEDDRQERREMRKVLADVDQLFRTLQASGKFEASKPSSRSVTG